MGESNKHEEFPIDENIVAEKEHHLYATSPFLYHEGIDYMCDNQKTNITFEELNTLSVNKKITKLDLEIFELLNDFQVLNRHNIEYAFTNLVSASFSTTAVSLKKTLSKLVNMGAILRYYFYWVNNEEQKQTPCFYMLSPTVARFLRKKRIHSVLKPEFILPEVNTVLQMLAYNQFELHMMAAYKNELITSESFCHVSVKGYDFIVDGYFRLPFKNRITTRKSFVDLVAVLVRRKPNWQEEMCTRIKLIYEYSKAKRARFHSPIILVICEDDSQIKEAYIAKNTDASTHNVYVLFTTDISILKAKPLDNLIECSSPISEEQENFNPTTQNIVLNFIHLE